MSIYDCLQVLEQIYNRLSDRNTDLIQNARNYNHHCEGEETEWQYKYDYHIFHHAISDCVHSILDDSRWQNNHESVLDFIL